jgi:hypothetical protein
MPGIGQFASVKIFLRETGEQIDLWQPLYPFVTSVTIDMNLGLHTQITVTMDIPYTEGLKLFSETPMFHRGNVLTARVGYTGDGRQTPWFSGVVIDPAVNISPNGVSVTLVAKGAGALAVARCFIGQHKGTIEDWVVAVGERFGWLVDIDETSGLQEEINFAGAGDNFLQITSRYLNKAKYYFWLANNEDGKATLFVRQRGAVVASEAVHKFVMFGQPDTPNNVHPILSWNAPSKASLFAKGSAGVQQVYMDEDGEIVTVAKVEADSEDQSLGEQSAETGQADEVEAETGEMIDKTLAEDEASLCLINLQGTETAEDDVLSRRDELFMGVLGIEGNCSSIGVPELLPATLVQVSGCSSRFDGLYQIFRVTHRVDGSGFDTSWVGKRNGLPTNSGGVDTSLAVNPSTLEA